MSDWQERLANDNQNAKWLAHEFASIPDIHIDPDTVHTNIVRFSIDPKTLRRKKLDHRGVKAMLLNDFKIDAQCGRKNNNLRFVTHRDVDRQDCENAVKAVKWILM